MKVHCISPGAWSTSGNDASGALAHPVYYVFFWDFRDDGSFTAEHYELVGAASVTEAIAWQERNAGSRMSATLLCVPDGADPGAGAGADAGASAGADGGANADSGDCADAGAPRGSLYLLHGDYPEGLDTDFVPDFGWRMYSDG